MTTSNTPVMDALVDFVLGLELAALPPAVIEAANRSMIDWLGTAIRGSIEPLADAMAAVIAATGGARRRRSGAAVRRRARCSHRSPTVLRATRSTSTIRTCRPCFTAPPPSRRSCSRSENGGVPPAPTRSRRS
jgi:hypothetical protein